MSFTVLLLTFSFLSFLLDDSGSDEVHSLLLLRTSLSRRAEALLDFLGLLLTGSLGLLNTGRLGLLRMLLWVGDGGHSGFDGMTGFDGITDPECLFSDCIDERLVRALLLERDFALLLEICD